MSARTPFRRLLIANRGEVALRIQRSAHAFGCETVAVHSDADAGAPHVRHAGRAVRIGEAPPARSYLNVDALIDAARRAGADAVHPGYGFLAESADFAQACVDAGLVFVGPSPSAIAAMADKAAARRAMARAGVPCVAGYDGDDCSDARLAVEAEAIGYPLIVKARAGGGGRGMRGVDEPAALAAALRAARSEAGLAFGDDRLLLERRIVDARHVEVQVLADRDGRVVHLGERDCSIQRRHQKLIEEAPSPAVGDELRERLGAVAIAAARTIGYEGAGTVEFLLDRDGRFWFIEMNTRLQVEHPVTEAVYDVDLVAWQLRLAAGEPLDLEQHALRPRGHAIEVRLCAEDPAAGFVPQSGTMLRWHPAPTLRTESALESGADVVPHYDSMIAKLIAWAPDRDRARRRLAHGLAQTIALGVRTNRDFLIRALSHPGFAGGDATIDFVSRHLPELATEPVAAARLAAVAALLLRVSPPRTPAPHDRFSLRPRPPAHALLAVDDRDVVAAIAPDGDRAFVVTIDGRRCRIRLLAVDDSRVRYDCDGIVENANWARDGDALWLSDADATLRVRDRTLSAPARAAGANGGAGPLRATMTGRVVQVFVAVGDRVVPGQPLVSLEAMKIEHVFAAPATTTVAAVHVTPGAQVPAGAVLVELACVAAPV